MEQKSEKQGTEKTVLFYALPAYGHIHSNLYLTEQLSRAGYRVIYYATESYREEIEANGGEYRAYPLGDKAIDASDGTSACVLTKSEDSNPSAILYGCQRTWSEGAHDTEIRGGGGLMPAFSMNAENREDYYFDMKGKRILKLSAKCLPGFVEHCLKEAGVTRDEIDLVVPHQASRALNLIMPRLGFGKGTYIDRVPEYGNLISASVPYALCEAVEEGRIKRGDLILLIGTAAGLTANFLLMRF